MTKKKTPTAKRSKPAKAESLAAATESKPAEADAIAPANDASVSEETQPKPKPPEVDVEVSSCPNCGSTERTGYHSTKCRELSGVHNGRPYKTVVWKRTKCRGCGKNRIDRFHLNRKPRKSDGERLGK